MMEKPDVRHGHCYPVFVAGLDHVVVADGAAGLGDIGDAASGGSLDIVAEREESV